MRRIIRLASIAVLIGSGIVAAARPAQAQYMYGYGGLYGDFRPFNPLGFQVIPRNWFGPLPPLRPLTPLPGVNAFNPLMFNPFSRQYNPSIQAATLYYGLNRLYGQSYSPSTPSYTPYPSVYSAPTIYPSTYTRMYGARKGNSPYYNYEKAQENAEKRDERALTAERAAQSVQAAKEKAEAQLARALATNDPAVLSTGEPENAIYLAIVKERSKDTKRGKIETSHLSPNLLSEIRFAGGANATALNLLGPGSKWEPPEVFTNGPLGKVGEDLQRDFAAAVEAPLAGLPPDQVKVAELEKTLGQAKTYLDMVIDNLSFDGAVAARGFLDRLNSLITVLKNPASTGLIDPRWATEGTSIADLVAHMDRYKVRFGAAPDGNADAYVALHKGLSAYLFALQGAELKGTKQARKSGPKE